MLPTCQKTLRYPLHPILIYCQRNLNYLISWTNNNNNNDDKSELLNSILSYQSPVFCHSRKKLKIANYSLSRNYSKTETLLSHHKCTVRTLTTMTELSRKKVMKKVAVVGCGAAGLCVLRHLTEDPMGFEVVGFEQAPHIGGTWVYSPNTGYNDYGLPVHTSIYKNLRTNLPKDVMCFPDFPYHPDLPSFLHHTDVRAYLENYAQHFHLLKHIKFQTKIELVEAVPDDSQNSVKWKVSYLKVLDNLKENLSAKHDEEKVSSDIFDAIIICNGRYSIPYIPEIKGQDIFQGVFIHSHDYREPEEFAGKTVVCLGAKSSGIDIGIELASHAKKVFLSHRYQPSQAEFPENMFQKPGIRELTSDGVVFVNGDFEPIDALILCTGYKVDFPFLHENCGVRTEHNRVTPFYKHLININFPNMAIVGLCMNITPLPLFHIQALFVKAVLSEKLALPDTVEMRKDEQEDFEQRLKDGMGKHHAHVLGDKQWDYNNELASICGCELLPKHIEDIYEFVKTKRSKFPAKYKEMDIDAAYGRKR